MIDIVIIGGGAAGLMAAGRAREFGASVLVLEKMEKPARKIRITGKGRCNITNTRSREEFMAKVRNGAEFCTPAWMAFDNGKTMRFLSALGLDITVERGGRVFPTSGKAWDVANTIEYWAKDLGAEIRCDSRVVRVVEQDGVVCGVELEGGEILDCRCVVVCTGGASYPRTGSTGDGYSLAHQLGHTIVPLAPALIPLEIDEPLEPFRGLDLFNVGVRLVVDGNVEEECLGEVEFTDKAMGGAVILQMSRTAVAAIIDNKSVEIEIDLKPALDNKKLRHRLGRDIKELGDDAPLYAMLNKLTPRRLHNKIVDTLGITTRMKLGELDDSLLDSMVSVLKSLRFGISDYRPFEEAIVTAGGVSLDEVEPTTMGSKITKGLYFAGEVLDIDADTGGYNIQLALSTGRLAADGCCKAIGKKQLLPRK